MLSKMINTSIGRITLNSDIPDDFKAVSSLFSARFPKVMIEENRTANGKASGMSVAET